jgi:hypothetical protein
MPLLAATEPTVADAAVETSATHCPAELSNHT